MIKKLQHGMSTERKGGREDLNPEAKLYAVDNTPSWLKLCLETKRIQETRVGNKDCLLPDDQLQNKGS